MSPRNKRGLQTFVLLGLLALCIPAHAEPVSALVSAIVASAASYAGVLAVVPPVLGCGFGRARKQLAEGGRK